MSFDEVKKKLNKHRVLFHWVSNFFLKESRRTTIGTEAGDTVDEKKSVIKSVRPKTLIKGFSKKTPRKKKTKPKKPTGTGGAPNMSPHDAPPLQLGTPLGKNAVKSEVIRYRS
ncbi:hypothetical protein Y032_0758g2106 [Ancylostoma ceylanicum]|uniref:Uncharacterized protein n=1 Tax=Ancylostoma ceylanicum TaxID=53326 RepID=A0A016WE23_9BILA|nr:hypothetical protein Y032_0758g2106 [Ancylostoma ceylanicum]